MSQMTQFSSPYMLGFDEIEQLLDRIGKSANDGFPPYNIERVGGSKNASNGKDILRITLAVAGFTQDQLDVSVEESQLIIRGRQNDDTPRNYLHQGIAARQFQRTFVLAEGIEVEGASLADGLLSIDLVRNEPERIIRTIEIKS